MNPVSLAQSFLMDVATGTVDNETMRDRARQIAHDLEPHRMGGPDAEAMRALWTICWQTGQGCYLRIMGTHDNWERVVVGEYTFEGSWSEIAPRIIEWAEMLSHREANAPVPAPPPVVT